MELDVRLPMGVMFVALGAVLMITGVASDAAVNAKSLGINVNLWWGMVMCSLGAVMLALVWRARGKS
jgi:hypothetical protein